MTKIMLDGKELEVEQGTTILRAARAQSIDIPTFCYKDQLSIQASCRMCLIEIEGRRKLEPACATVVADDMVIHTRSQKVVTARENMLEILLANHPLDCPICDKGGECELQDTVYDYGKGDSRFFDEKRVFRTQDISLNDVIIFNAQRCIQCQRCVRVCEELVGEVALGTAERGLDAEITGVGNSLKDCSHCGNCIEVCPVGALMSTPYRYKARPWDLVKTETICNMCGTGCSMSIETRDGALSRVKSAPETGLNGELLCAKGRFGFDSIDGGERIREPMIRKNGALTPVSWEEAIQYIADTAQSIQNRGGRIEGLISPRQTNETAYRFQHLMRSVFKTDVIHSSCRFGGLDRAGLDQLQQLLAHRYSRLPLQSVLNADCLLLLGSNITAENPVTGYLIRATLRDRHNQLLIASSRPCGMDDIANASLRLRPGDEAGLLAALTGDDVPAAEGIAEFVTAAKPVISAAESVTLLVGTEFLRGSAAAPCLAWIENAATRMEAEGKTVSVQFLFDRPNQLGLWDMGCLSLSTDAGQTTSETDTVPDMLYVLGSDPLQTSPESHVCELAALQTPCLVVHSAYQNKTAEKANVVLPAPSYGEEDGTYTNNEGRVQRLRAIRPPTVGVAATAVGLSRIAAAMGSESGPNAADGVFAELAAIRSAYRDMKSSAAGNELGFTRALPFGSANSPSPDILPPNPPRSDYVLITGDSQFQSGYLSARSDILTSLGSGPYIEINPGEEFEDNSDGLLVTVSRMGAAITAPMRANKSFAKGVVYVPEHLLGTATGKLLSAQTYPCPVEVKIHKAGG